MVPEDRLRQGLIPMHTVAENLSLPLLCRRRSFGWLSLSHARRLAEDQVKQMRIRLKSVSNPVRSLSGGNQQKVALARWLATNPSLLILDEPTAGIDIGSKREIAAKIRSLAHAGKAILLISSDLVELLSISDRIVVMAKGRLVASVLPHQCSQEQLQMVIQSANTRD
jgi:ribose transport system ATP-binding protein